MAFLDETLIAYLILITRYLDFAFLAILHFVKCVDLHSPVWLSGLAQFGSRIGLSDRQSILAGDGYTILQRSLQDDVIQAGGNRQAIDRDADDQVGIAVPVEIMA